MQLAQQQAHAQAHAQAQAQAHAQAQAQAHAQAQAQAGNQNVRPTKPASGMQRGGRWRWGEVR